MRCPEPRLRGRYTGQLDMLRMPLWTQEIPYRTWREQLEERSITGRDPFAKQSSRPSSVTLLNHATTLRGRRFICSIRLPATRRFHLSGRLSQATDKDT